MKGSNPRAVLAADMELGAGNVLLLRLAEHGADMDMPRVTFDTGVDGIAAWTPLSLRTLTQRAAARAGWFARHGIGRADPVAVFVTSAADVFLNFFALTWLGAIPALVNGSMPPEVAVEFIRRLVAAGSHHAYSGRPQPFAEIILMYRDEEGYFYHVDRASDALDLGDGKWLYSALKVRKFLMRQRLLASR